jgi:hypothetical protein
MRENPNHLIRCMGSHLNVVAYNRAEAETNTAAKVKEPDDRVVALTQPQLRLDHYLHP